MEVVHHLMCSVGVLGVHNLPPVAVELPDQRGIGDKGLHCGQLLGLVGAPVATGTPVMGNQWEGAGTDYTTRLVHRPRAVWV